MFSWSNFFIGLVMTALGVLGVKYTFWLRNTLGTQDWIERYTGSGSTYGVLKIFSLFLAIFGLLIATGLGTPLLEWVLTPFSNMFKPFRQG